MSSYARDTRLIFIANVVALLAGLLSQSLLAWTLLPAGRGEYAACVIFSGLLVLAFALGQEMANVYYVGNRSLSPSEAMTQSLACGLAMSLVACAVGYTLTVAFPQRFAVAPLADFRLALLYVPFAILRMFLQHVLLGIPDTLRYTLLNLGTPVLMAVGLALAALVGLTVATALAVQIASEALGTAAALYMLVRTHYCRLVPLHLANLRRTLGYGFRFYFGKLASMANVQIGPIIVAAVYADREMVGMYTAAAAIFSRIWILGETLQLALLPRTVADPTGQARMVAQVLRMCLACCGALTLVAAVLAKPIIAILLGPDFLPVLVPVWILLPGILIRVVSKVLPAYFAGVNRPQITSLGVGVAVAVDLGLMLVLLPRWGLAGLAAAVATSYAVEALIMSLAFRAYARLPLSTMFVFSRADGDALFAATRKVFGQRNTSVGAASNTTR